MTLSGKKRQATLVVGTTPDYIAWIRRTGPGRCLFLTDPAARETAAEPPPGAEEEILCDLDDYELAAARLDDHLAGRGLALDGISCFDCESMDLAAVLAEQYGLPYPSRDAIGLCRSKYLSKNRWRENGLPCPRVEIIRNGDEAERCLMQMGGQMVLKPATGSGSEFVYRCRSAGESRANYELISSAIHERRSNRLYRSHTLIVGEEFVDGEEYSCDFIIDEGRVTLVRLTKKIRAQTLPFGTTLGYVLCHPPSGEIEWASFRELLARCAAALQIGRGICMLDFMIRNEQIVLLELAPRAGGDCLPYLLRQAQGLDMLKLSLDFAGRGETGLTDHRLPPASGGFVGMRILAKTGGILRELDVGALEADPRILEIGLAKKPGDAIVMPPGDYDSWVLGHVIVRLEPGQDPADELYNLDGKIRIAMERP